MDSEDLPTNPRIPVGADTIQDIVARRYSRRSILQGAAAFGIGAVALPGLAGCEQPKAKGSFNFSEISRGTGEMHVVPNGYTGDILLRWGDPLFADSPIFDPLNQSAEAQARQFGYNNDFIGFIPLESAPGEAARGLLFVNHEYTIASLMFPNVAAPAKEGNMPDGMTAELCATERAAHGASIVEIVQKDGRWQPVIPSRYNRRITADSDMILTGPAAGHSRLKTAADPTARAVKGMVNNCAGGVTPWGTFLTCEENFNKYFTGKAVDEKQAAHLKRYGFPSEGYAWGKFESRFDLASEPNEPNRFGWVVEVDPHDPASLPKKRTALGHFKHEGAESIVAPNGKVVVYMGDDQHFDYVYKFVTAHAFDRTNPSGNRDILDEGVLHVARFNEDGTLDWLPIIHGQEPLTEKNGFASQADVLIETRRAADLLGATPMDRPEDIEPDPRTGRVYVNLTHNEKRKPSQLNAANPRALDKAGHIIEIIEPEGDFSSTKSQWNILVLCGDPSDKNIGAKWNPATSANGWFGSPDNCAVDPKGRLWIATDGNPDTGANDGFWALETEGELRGTGRAFFRAPDGAEVTGPRFAPDGKTLFISVQHPGDGDGTDFAKPATRWPDFHPTMPPRPSVVAIRRDDGGVVGG